MIGLGLAGADGALVEQRRVEEYLLNSRHAEGDSMAKFFLNRGFTRLLWQEFADALVGHGRTNLVTRVAETEWGTVTASTATSRRRKD